VAMHLRTVRMIVAMGMAMRVRMPVRMGHEAAFQTR
jgi:hypothetical protein